MIAREIEVELQLPDSKSPRSEGVHVSGIIRCIATEQGILKREWLEELSLTDRREITDPVAILRIRIGLAWEEHYIPTLLGVLDHPDEMCVDGIYMSPDGESVSTIISETRYFHAVLIHEVKATYKSTKTVGDLASQWMWMAQIKAYCNAVGTRFAMLHCLFLCGDYKFPIKPILKVWQIEFTQQEIDSNWSLLKDYRDYAMRDKEDV